MSLPSSRNGEDSFTDGEDHDPQFEPIISLPEVNVKTMEEDEIVLMQQRAKLFRRDTAEKEWKERGTGDVKLLHNEKLNTVRIVMRRDKTYKLCANHYVTPDMKLNPNCGSDRAWVWTTMADVADGIPKVEILAIKFLNTDAAKKWKDKFEEAKSLISQELNIPIYKGNEDDEKDKSSEISENSDTNSENEEEVDVTKEIESLNLDDGDINEVSTGKKEFTLIKTRDEEK